MKSSCPASLGTLRVSVPPAVKLAVASRARPTLDLDDFVNRYFGCSHVSAKREAHGSQSRGYSGSRFERKESERFKRFSYEELTKRDNVRSLRTCPTSLDTLTSPVPPAVKLALPALTSIFSG